MIKVQNLNIAFNSKVYIENINFTIAKGEKAVITGPSGIGKSSIFHTLLGFYAPENAEIEIEGVTLDKTTIHEIRSKVAWLPQNMNLFGDIILKDILSKIAGYGSNAEGFFSKVETHKLMSELGLDLSLLDQVFKDLSGGEKQRAGMLITLLLKRPIVLLDEPGAALDKETKSKAIDLFLKNDDLTVLSISHDDEWIQACDKEIRVPGIKK